MILRKTKSGSCWGLDRKKEWMGHRIPVHLPKRKGYVRWKRSFSSQDVATGAVKLADSLAGTVSFVKLQAVFMTALGFIAVVKLAKGAPWRKRRQMLLLSGTVDKVKQRCH